MGRSLVATYSIVACDLDAGQWGVAVQSKFLAVGSVVPWAEPHVGAIATQSYANPRYGPDGLALLREGRSAEEVVSTLTAADEGRAQRQVGVVDGAGRAATFTGEECHDWAGGRTGDGYAAQGNILVSAATVDALATTFEQNGHLELVERLVECLAAAQAAGGDRRGQQSASLLVVEKDAGYAKLSDTIVDLCVDCSRSTRRSSASLLAKTGSAWTRHLRASWATGWRSSATTERSTRHSSTGPERRISRSASTASGKSTRSCSKHYANNRHEDDPNQRHRSDSHREGRAPVATGPAHARNRGLRHQRLHGECRGARRRGARRDRRGCRPSRGALPRRHGSRDVHRGREERRRARRDARLPRRPEGAARSEGGRRRDYRARDRRRARRALSHLAVGVRLRRDAGVQGEALLRGRGAAAGRAGSLPGKSFAAVRPRVPGGSTGSARQCARAPPDRARGRAEVRRARGDGSRSGVAPRRPALQRGGRIPASVTKR